MLVDGKWTADWQPVQATDAKGGFVRQISGFRSWVTPDGSAGPTGEGGFKAEAGRYHLYVALICPWASRTLIGRKLKKLEDVISVSVVEPALSDEGWRFGDYPGADRDTLNGANYMHEIYTGADPHYTGRATVPVLWDKQTKTIVNNESSDILRMLNSGFGVLADNGIDLYSQTLATEIDALNDRIYPRLNNGVYRIGFATTQAAYEEAFADVFSMLDELETRLATNGPYLFGGMLTETDIRLFLTLVRFDAAYFGLFKCNLHRIADYPALQAYMMRVLTIPGVRETVSIDHIKRGYYSIKALNPTMIVPVGPDLPVSMTFLFHGHKSMATRNLVILLHGVGSNGANLAPVGDLCKETLPDTDFVSPDGPFPFGRGPGRQWFSIDGVTEANHADRVAAARPEFDRVIGNIIESHGLDHDTGKVAFVGFSQGSIMALDVLACERLPLAAIVAFSGRLASPEPIHPATGTKLCLIHGDADPIMPFVESEKAAATLKGAGVDSTLHILPGLGHSISQEGAQIAGAFLAKAFAG